METEFEKRAEKIFETEYYMDNDNAEEVYDYICSILEDMMHHNPRLITYGYTGRWDGPDYGGRYIEDIDQLKDRVLNCDCVSGFRMKDNHEFRAHTCSRYCSAPTELSMRKDDFVIVQLHHDGVNVYIFRKASKRNAKDITGFKKQFNESKAIKWND